MGIRETYRKILMQACIAEGDETELAFKLRVPVRAVVAWLLGDAPVPVEIFLKAVDILVAGQGQAIKDTTAFLEAVKVRHKR